MFEVDSTGKEVKMASGLEFRPRVVGFLCHW
jgi:hypothetical protein